MQFAQRIESGGGRSDDLQGLPKPSDPRSGAALGRDNDLAVNDRRTGSDVPGVVSNLAETIGPVVAEGEDLDRLVGDVNLHAVAVELDLTDPALAAQHFFDICRKGRFDEAGCGRKRAVFQGIRGTETRPDR
jgi:hypothetical protein